MHLGTKLWPLCLTFLVGGCASSGPVPMGPDTYMLSNTGTWRWSLGGALTGDLFREANAFCSQQGKQMLPVNTTSNNGSLSQFAQANVQFRCLAAGDPELRRPDLSAVPSIRVEQTAR